MNSTMLVVADLQEVIATARKLLDADGSLAYLAMRRDQLTRVGLAEDQVAKKIDVDAGDLAEINTALHPATNQGPLSASAAGTLASAAVDAARIVAGRFPFAWRDVEVDPAIGEAFLGLAVADDAPVLVRVIRGRSVRSVEAMVERHDGWNFTANLLTAALWMAGGEPTGGLIALVTPEADSKSVAA